MTAKESLQGLQRFAVDLVRYMPPGGKREPSRISVALEEISRKCAAARTAEPTELDIKRLEATFRDCIKYGGLDAIPRRDWRRAPWVIWAGDPPLIKSRDFRNRLFQRTEKGRALRTLIYVYLRDFKPGLPFIKDIGAHIGKMLQLSGAGGGPLDGWRRRHTKLAIFDAEGAPNRVMQHLLAGKASVERLLEEIGVSGELAEGGLAREAYILAATEIRARLKSRRPDKVMEQFLDWSRDEGGLRYPDLDGVLANALLEPWVERQQTPPEDVRQRILDFLISHMGDPRVQPQKWNRVSESARAEVLRWLTSVTLEAFFEVLDKVARTAPDSQRLWKFRRDFWMAYHAKGYIDGAWLALGSMARFRAREAFEGAAVAGDLTGFSSPDRSAILIKIGNLIIAEHSPMGRVWIWGETNLDAPDLYRRRYHKADVMNDADFDQVHHGGERGRWQARVAEFIRRRTNIRIEEREYLSRIRRRR